MLMLLVMSVMMISGLVLLAQFVLSVNFSLEENKLSSLESGFEMLKSSFVFGSSFLLLAVLFVFFDVELVLLVPFVLFFCNIYYWAGFLMLVLVFLVGATLFFEWKWHGLKWQS